MKSPRQLQREVNDLLRDYGSRGHARKARKRSSCAPTAMEKSSSTIRRTDWCAPRAKFGLLDR